MYVLGAFGHDHRDHALADLHALAEPLSVDQCDGGLDVEVATLAGDRRVLLVRHARRQFGAGRGVEPARTGRFHGQAAVETVLGATAIVIGAGRHAHVTEQVETLARRCPPEVRDRLADTDRGVSVVADGTAVAVVRVVRHAVGVHRDTRIDLRQERAHLGRLELVGQRHLDAFAGVRPQHERTGTDAAAVGRVTLVAVRRISDDRGVPVLHRRLVLLQHVEQSVGISVAEMLEAVRAVLRDTRIVDPSRVRNEGVDGGDVVRPFGGGPPSTPRARAPVRRLPPIRPSRRRSRPPAVRRRCPNGRGRWD